MAKGLSPESIAAQRLISVGTVRMHVKQIYSKLGVGKQIELMALLNAS